MDPVIGAVLVMAILVVALVLGVLWWRRQDALKVGANEPRPLGDFVSEDGERPSLRNPVHERRRRDDRQRGLGLH